MTGDMRGPNGWILPARSGPGLLLILFVIGAGTDWWPWMLVPIAILTVIPTFLVHRAETRGLPGLGLVRYCAWATVLLPGLVLVLERVVFVFGLKVLPRRWLSTQLVIGISAAGSILIIAVLLVINAIAFVALVNPGRLGWLRDRLDRLPTDGASAIGIAILRVGLLILLGAIPLIYLIVMSSWLSSGGSDLSMAIRVPIVGIYGIAWFAGSTFLIRREIARFRVAAHPSGPAYGHGSEGSTP